MRNSWKERIISALAIGIFVFISECIISKLFESRDDWLSYSIIWSISWAVGYFISKTITTMDESLWKIIGVDLVIIFFAFIILTFVLGVVCDMTNWGKIVSDIIASFGMSMIINNKWKRD